MKKSVFLSVSSFLLFAGESHNQSSITDPKKWGVETELISPFLVEGNISRI